MMYWNGHMTTAGRIIAVLWTVIILALIAGAIYWFVSELSRRSRREASATGEGSAREILDRRLAKGELTVEQYKELRATLDGEATVAADKPPLPSQPASAPG
jgi:uncharacterized membrane protein